MHGEYILFVLFILEMHIFTDLITSKLYYQWIWFKLHILYYVICTILYDAVRYSYCGVMTDVADVLCVIYVTVLCMLMCPCIVFVVHNIFD